MDKLQKLLESKITYEINALDYSGGVYVTLRLKNNEEELCEQFLEIESAINWVWQAAKKHYPDAECFKIEKKSNFEKWKDFFNDLPSFMCDRFCEVLAKKFDEAGLDAELILEVL